ncbi:hypothetical protein ACFSVK_13165 [Azorhizophilus paspali]|uniref:hypothetical protein n=1 Tax=Azorhizophilus paspali TaxID=69963 RepID=UPI0036414684
MLPDCSEPPQPEPCNHNDLPRALAIVARLRPAETVPTHIGHNLDAWLMRHPTALPARGQALRARAA